MRYLDVCAGISASSVAWKPLGWEAAAYSEIEPAPRAILEHRQGALPVGWDHRHAAGSNTTPLFGDFTQIEAHHVGPIDLLVGGTPCQDFSIAGLRAGLGGDRGNLSLQFLLLAARTRARWVVWENVPGVFSSLSHDAPDQRPPEVDLDGNNGPADGEEVVVADEYDADESHALACFLAGLSELGYGVAYRVLDAQFAGVPQRRRRIFVVGYLGDWRRAAAVLLERHSLSGHPAPRRETEQNLAGSLSASSGRRGGVDDPERGNLIAGTLSAAGSRSRGAGSDVAMLASTGEIAHCLNAGGMGRQDYETETLIAHRATVAFDLRNGTADETTMSVQAGGMGDDRGLCPNAIPHVLGAPPALAFDCKASGQNGFGVGDVMSTLRSMGHSNSHQNGGGHASVQYGSAVRRLTPRECERLQGFPDDYTLVPNRGKPMADGPRYKALGNSMAVPVMRWIGERIAAVDAIPLERRDAA